MTWTRRTSGFDLGVGNGVCWSPELSLFAAIGYGNYGVGPTIITSPEGTVWTDQVSPFDDSYGTGIVWSSILGLFVAVGSSADVSTIFATSPDGFTWTGCGNPFPTPSGQANCVAVKPSTGICLIGTSGYDQPMVKTTDGIVYTPIASPFDGAGGDNDGGYVIALAYSPSLDRWLAIGWDASGSVMLCYSDDDGSSWTTVLTDPVVDPATLYPLGLYWDETNGRFWFLGQLVGGEVTAWSPDATSGSWTAVTTPLDGGGAGYAAVNAGGSLLGLVGYDATSTFQMVVSTDGGDTFDWDASKKPLGDGDSAYGLTYSPDLDLGVVVGYSGLASGLPSVVPPPPPVTLYWTPRPSPLDGGYGYGGCWGIDRLEFLAVGAMGSTTVLKSLDAITWDPQTTPFDGATCYGVARNVFHSLYVAAGISPDAADSIITSPDGETWTGCGNPLIGGGRGESAAVRVSDGAILAAGLDIGAISLQQLVVSTDDGASWSDLSLGVGVTGEGFDVSVRDSDDLILFAGQTSSGPVAISTDAGATWTFPSIAGLFTARHCAIRQSDGALIVSDSGGQVWISTNDGASWTLRHPFAGFGGGAGFIIGIAVRPSDGAIIAVGWHTPSGGAKNAFAISTDDGATWTTSRPYGSVISELLCATTRISDDAIIVGGTGGGGFGSLIVSTDNGSSWTSLTDPPGGSPASVRLRAADDLIVVASASPDSVAVSSDGGSSWAGADPFSGGFGSGCAIRESDGALISVGQDSTQEIQFSLSTDDGATWGAADPLLFSAATGIASCVACKQSNGAVVIGATNLPKVIATSSDAVTYALVSSPFDGGQVFGIDYSESEDLWIAAGIDSIGNTLVCSSADDGATWTVLSPQPMTWGNTNPRVYRDETHSRWWLLGPTTGGESAAFSDDSGATWTEVSAPFDGSSNGAVSAILGPGSTLVIAALASGNPAAPAIAESPDSGAAWVADTSPFDESGGAYHVFASPSTFVAVGYAGDFSVAIATASTTPPEPPPPATGHLALSVDDTVIVVDAETLDVIATVPVSSGPQGLAFSHDGRYIAVACSSGTVDVIETTGYTVVHSVVCGTDPWAVSFTPDDFAIAVIHQSSDGLFVIDTTLWAVTNTLALGSFPNGLAFSPSGDRLAVTDGTDNTLTIVETVGWTVANTVSTGSGAFGVDWAADESFVVVANQGDNTITAYAPLDFSIIATTPVGTSPTYLDASEDATTVVVLNSGDNSLSILETTSWTVTDTSKIAATLDDLTYTPEGLNVALAANEGSTGEVRIVTTDGWSEYDEASIGDTPFRIAASLPATEPPEDQPIPKALKNTWRWVVCGLDGSIKSFLDKIATNVQIAYVLDDAAMMTCDVPSDYSEVYQLTNPDTLGHRYPRVNYGNRVIYGLRREEPHGKPPWVCRFAGVIDILQDQAAEDDPITHLTAYDPWQWARSLPVLNVDGSLLGSGGLTYEGKTADYIARDLIANAYAWIVATFPDPMPWTEIGDDLHLPNDGEHNYIDITTGHFDTCAVIDSINFAQGMSVGEAWSQLCQTGTIDIVLRPVFGPEADKPGVLCVMNVYAQAGKERPNALFGWDLFPRNLVGVDHLLDGTQIENIGQFYAGNIAVPVAENTQSINTYGPRYVQKNYPAGSNVAAVQLLALAELALRMRGKKTLLVDPTPGLAPDPFTHYGLGDVVPVWAGRPMPPPPPLVGHGVGNALRGGIRSYALGTNRVYGFAINLSDDLQETVQNLLLSDPDESI